MTAVVVNTVRALTRRPDGMWDATLVHDATGEELTVVVKAMDLARFRSFRKAVAKQSGVMFVPADEYTGPGSTDRWDAMVAALLPKK